MPFPFTIRQQIHIRVAGPEGLEHVRNRLIAALEKEKAKNLSIEESEIRFRGGIFRMVSSDNVLGPITTGWIGLTYAEGVSNEGGGVVTVSYRLTLPEIFMIATFLALFIFYFVRMEERLLVLCWLWLFGGNYALTYFRFPRFLRTAAMADVPV